MRMRHIKSHEENAPEPPPSAGRSTPMIFSIMDLSVNISPAHGVLRIAGKLRHFKDKDIDTRSRRET